jgi:hypothetical protein
MARFRISDREETLVRVFHMSQIRLSRSVSRFQICGLNEIEAFMHARGDEVAQLFVITGYRAKANAASSKYAICVVYKKNGNPST